MSIVVAIPTIPVRGDAWEKTADIWIVRSPVGTICVPSWRKGGWAQGLNEVAEVNGIGADTFVCGSDDMVPEEGWYEACEPWLAQGFMIAPQVHDPRFSRWDETTKDGDETRMSSFPILPKAVLPYVFPIEAHEPQHYFADDLISDKARKGGFKTVAVPSCVIVHTMDRRGRGAGMGSEEARMIHDKRIYRKFLAG